MKVKELMTPVSEYTTLDTDTTLSEAVAALSKSSHNDVLVLNADGKLAGVLTMTDILAALEPSYKKLLGKEIDGETLTNKYVADIFKEFGLWSSTLTELCGKCANVKLSQAMYVPSEAEYLDEEDNIEFGVHHYITGVHQPLIVRQGTQVTGVLRLGDVFTEIKKRITSCTC
jgi:CBS domain containing-hemolysin-like protein